MKHIALNAFFFLLAGMMVISAPIRTLSGTFMDAEANRPAQVESSGFFKKLRKKIKKGAKNVKKSVNKAAKKVGKAVKKGAKKAAKKVTSTKAYKNLAKTKVGKVAGAVGTSVAFSAVKQVKRVKSVVKFVKNPVKQTKKAIAFCKKNPLKCVGNVVKEGLGLNGFVASAAIDLAKKVGKSAKVNKITRFGDGVIKGLTGTVTALGHAALHPVNTLRAIGSGVENVAKKGVVKSIKSGVKNLKEACKGKSAGCIGQAIGSGGIGSGLMALQEKTEAIAKARGQTDTKFQRLGKGFVGGTTSMLGGVGNLIVHSRSAIGGLAHLADDPVGSAVVIAKTWAADCRKDAWECAGRVGFEALGALGTGGAAVAGKSVDVVGRVGRTGVKAGAAVKASKAMKAAKAGKAAEKAAKAAKSAKSSGSLAKGKDLFDNSGVIDAGNESAGWRASK
jgi:hypothetical protein